VDLELDGKVALVTGASRGLGAAIATGLAAEGAVVVAAARSGDDLKAVAATSPGRISAIEVDLLDERGTATLVDRVVERHGRIDVLVNNAGVAPAGDFVTQSPEVWQRAWAINVLAPMLLAQAAARHFVAQRSGKIVNVASTTGVRGKPLLVAYSTTKGALTRFTEALAAELAQHDVQVNTIAPGAFVTEAQQAVLDSPDLLQRRIRRIPAKRMADPEEIVALACLLASPRSDFVTGSTFVIDGGESGKL
jgi:2-dehydro-3-deoxy-D-gluconate 5-dehydrogenase